MKSNYLTPEEFSELIKFYMQVLKRYVQTYGETDVGVVLALIAESTSALDNAYEELAEE